ncbi:MAG: histidinol-phosphate transaminase [Rhodospirillaceae bacterium]|nr:histidinol-phosphate transaminase [Rhodospirillaceae bacterium]
MTLPQPRPGIMDIAIYEPGKSQVQGARRVIKLSSNEAALGPSPKAVAALAGSLGESHRYPAGDSGEVREALGKAHNLDPARIICGAGSDELLGLVMRGFAGVGDEIIHTAHGFAMYNIYAKGVGATPVVAPEKDLTTDVDAILARVTPKTRIVFVANPNNPTGTYIPGSEMRRLRAGLREDILLVCDDAYAEFVDAPDYESGFALASETENTIAMRTFSKIYGLASVRLGWGFGAKNIVGVMERIRSPFNVSRPAQFAGLAALADRDHVARTKAHTKKWLAIGLQRLRGLGLKVGESHGNFLLPEFPKVPGKTAAECDAFLQENGIIVRRVDGYGLPNHLRVTIGDEEEMTVLLDVMAAFMERK